MIRNILIFNSAEDVNQRNKTAKKLIC